MIQDKMTQQQRDPYIDDTLPWADRNRLRKAEALLVGVCGSKGEEPVALEHLQ